MAKKRAASNAVSNESEANLGIEVNNWLRAENRLKKLNISENGSPTARLSGWR